MRISPTLAGNSSILEMQSVEKHSEQNFSVVLSIKILNSKVKVAYLIFFRDGVPYDYAWDMSMYLPSLRRSICSTISHILWP